MEGHVLANASIMAQRLIREQEIEERQREEEEKKEEEAQELTPSQRFEKRKALNKKLNFVDFACIFSCLLLIIILASSTSVLTDDPLLTLIYMLQSLFFYMMFRTKYAIQLPFMWCSSCSERRHLRFHFCNVMFSILVIVIDCFDFVKAMTKDHDSLVKSHVGLFLVELVSFPMAVAVILIFWLRPTWVLSEAAARREVDMM